MEIIHHLDFNILSKNYESTWNQLFRTLKLFAYQAPNTLDILRVLLLNYWHMILYKMI